MHLPKAGPRTWPPEQLASRDNAIGNMKTHKNLYGKVCHLDNLRQAFKKARKGKSKKEYVKEFEIDLEGNLLQLKKELENMTYEPGPLKIFVIRDPKTRVISASHFRDMVAHHALCSIIEPIFDTAFIHDSYASRKDKGTHAALRRFDGFKRKVSCNGRLLRNAKDSNMVIGHVLKADIKHYFPSVDHEVMMRIIRKRIKDKKLLWLIRKILDNHESKKPGKGMPIGNLTSQLFANIYLNELDYFVKHRLRAKYYIRYMDDFLILHKSKGILLEWKSHIADFLKTIKLELHPEKSRVFPLHRGVSFLGYRIFYHYKLLRKSNIRMLENRLYEFKKLHDKNEIHQEKTMQSLESWLAYARYADSYLLRKEIMKRFNMLFNVSHKPKPEALNE